MDQNIWVFNCLCTISKYCICKRGDTDNRRGYSPEKIVTSALLLCGFASVVLFDYGDALNYRSGRYDGLGILLVAIAAWGASHRGRLGMIALSSACLVMPAAAVHVAVCAGIAFSIALLVFRAAALPVVAVGFGSLALGAGLMLATLQYNSVLDVFFEAANHLRTVAPGSLPKDPSFWFLLAAGGLQMVRLRNLAWWRNSKLNFLALLGFLLPPIIYALGRFPTYYAWMSVLPLCALIFGLFELEFATRRSRKGAAAWGLVGLACLFGLPLQIASGVYWGEGRSYAAVRGIVHELKRTDVVVCDPSAYYAVRPTAAKTYLLAYIGAERWMSRQQLDGVTILVIRPEHFRHVSQIVGGSWQPGERTPQVATFVPVFRKNFGDKLIEVYDLQVFRRITPENS